MDDHAHGLVEDSLQALLRQGTALHVLALEFFFDDLAGSLAHDRCILRVLFHDRVFIAKVDFVPDENFWHVSHVFLQLWVPLDGYGCTFLRALMKEDGSMTEKTIRKTSQLG